MKKLTLILVILFVLTTSWAGEIKTLTNVFWNTNILFFKLTATNTTLILEGLIASQTNDPSKYIVEDMRTNGTLTGVVKELCASGEVCKATGHNWRDGRFGEGANFYYGDFHPNTAYRTCRTCGTVQSRSLDWK
jgi:hypothetical protein